MAYTTIKKPSDYFNTKLYTGNGGTQSITGVGFQPDWCWIKNRDQALNPVSIDSVRGLKYLYTSSTSAEGDFSSAFTSFDSDGFSVGANNNVNGSGNGIASWNWLANGTGVANTDGSISSTVSANTTSGFSIVSYTGTGANATVGHGLGSAPAFIVTKSRTLARSWRIYHQSLGNATSFDLDQTLAAFSAATSWNSTTPTSSVFSLGTASSTNESGANLIAYCFAEKKGFSKFGSYTGNGNADGTFVYTGFSPAFVMVRRTDAGDGWIMFDNKRSSFNIVDKNVQANSSNAETTSGYLDFTSNGFKLRMNGASANGSGASYIYMAFAEQPLVGDNPATAR